MAKGFLHEQTVVLDFRISNIKCVHDVCTEPLHHWTGVGSHPAGPFVSLLQCISVYFSSQSLELALKELNLELEGANL